MVILFDQFNLPEDIYKIIFATEQQEVVAKMLIKYMMDNGGEIGKTEMGIFATKLHEWNMILKQKGRGPFEKEERLSYNKRQFYDRILTPLRGMGLIDYDLYKKTYKISDKFNKMMIRIGLLWLRELEKNVKNHPSQTGGMLDRASRASYTSGFWACSKIYLFKK